MKITVIIGGNMWQAKHELYRRLDGLPRGSVRRISDREFETLGGEQLIARSGQDPHCLHGMDHKAEIVIVGQLELIRDEIRERIDYLRAIGSEMRE